MSSKQLFDLSGKVALVTGASRGIGEAIAHVLAEYGAEVVVTSRKVDECQRVADAICADGGKALAMGCHIGDMRQISETFSNLKDKFGRLDILVNNAATNPFFGHVLETDLGAFQKTVDVNIRGYFFMSVEAAKMMKAQGGGVICNTASISGVKPGSGQGIYSITKAAVINMTKTFAKECGPMGIRCNALLPGLTETKFASALTTDEKLLERVNTNLPLRRAAQPCEMAGAVLYLCSDAASYTTGECLIVDGGSLIA